MDHPLKLPFLLIYLMIIFYISNEPIARQVLNSMYDQGKRSNLELIFKRHTVICKVIYKHNERTVRMIHTMIISSL